ncbi:diguanylate cyclase [Svornostia abyssi]|uniref:Diguanylate cyclase n=2 Tax=Svornostia abyssi TaxID=2898438 RepID=A0ABY5PNS1_9ACTN|nr:diguanylate cyclase [Parviterribacteraceae bacterium J379]
MLDQETGLRGYNLNGLDEFLRPYQQGRADFGQALNDSRSAMEGDRNGQALLAEQAQISDEWRQLASVAVTQARLRDTVHADATGARQRKAVMDRFRIANTDYQRLIDERRESREAGLAWLSAGVVFALAVFFALLGAVVLRRQRQARRAARRREAAYVARQHDLGTGLQVARSEEEAHEVLSRHLELSVPGSDAAVLTRNNSENRLLLATEVPDDSPLTDRVADVEPRACLAVRLASRRHEGDAAAPSVLRCEVCGGLEGRADCSPLIVGGEVIGAALLRHPDPLSERQDRAVEESVAQAAPVLANLRNLALAESRAATDGLTGLPNRRSFEETLKRMAAQAGRTKTPLSALALDLDHFKSVNDTHGHEVGDEVLAAMGALLADLVRASDFAARIGGEEFVVLAPDTARDGAVALAETIRAAVREVAVPGVAQVTVSIGVASLPEDASTPSGLLRAADRLLYAAKERGRDRVEANLPVGESEPQPRITS